MVTTAVVCWLLLLSVGFCQEAVLTPPEYVAYEGQPEFTFQCTVTLPGLLVFLVLVNGQQLGSDAQGITLSDPVQLGDTTTHQRNITISAIQANRNTTIECVGVGIDIHSDTATCTFKLQGLLDPPNIYDPIEYNGFYQILTWTPPFTLDITDVDPDITYRVCNDSTDTCMDTADTSVLFETMCDPVEYYISACNPVDCGGNATMAFPQEPISFILTKVEFMYSNESEPMVYTELESGTFCFRSYVGVLEYLFGSKLYSTETGPVEPLVDGKTHTITLTQANGIVENANYVGQIGVEGLMVSILFFTFDVQDVDATYEEDGTITVTCTFARGSNAQGCLVKFRNLDGLDEKNITILRQPSVPEITQLKSSYTLNDLPDGEYEVVALDMESDGSVATNYEPMKRMYTFPPPTSAPTTDISPSFPSTSPSTVSPSTDSSPSDFPIGIIAGVAVSVVLVIAGAVVVLTVVACFGRKKSQRGGQTVSVTNENVSETTDANNLQTRSNPAYVTHQLRAKKIQMEECPAYERVDRRAVAT